eukprot:GILI01025038.1.p1 GENE.GILI01025038.1~~GILI01025038.1.p1  ORF type:complete len:290 (+),score=57.27 GILI01025038.1:123-992(+)
MAEYFSEKERIAIQAVTLTGASLSMLGSGMIVISYFAFHRLRTFPFKLICLLSISDFISSLAYFFSLRPEDSTLCYVGSSLTQFFNVATFFWTSIIAFNIYQALVKVRSNDEVKKLEIFYHIVGWGVPLILLIVVIATDALGYSGLWCWISNANQWQRWACYYAWLCLLLVYNVFIYFRISRSADVDDTRLVNRRLRLYLMAFIISRTPSVINRIQNAADPSHPVFVLFLFHAIFSPLQGFFNFLVYGLNKRFLQEITSLLPARFQTSSAPALPTNALKTLPPTPTIRI